MNDLDMNPKLRKSIDFSLHIVWWIAAAACIVVSFYSHEMGIWLYPISCNGDGCGYFQMNDAHFAQLAAIGISPALYGGLTVVLLAIQNLSGWLMGFLVYRYGRKDYFVS